MLAIAFLAKTINFYDIILIDERLVFMKSKKLRKKIESLRERTKEHKEKIEIERQKPLPNEGCIAHWEKEIMAFENQIEEAIKKLEG